MDIWTAFKENFFGYDFIIFIALAVNIMIFFKSKKTAEKLRDYFKIDSSKANKRRTNYNIRRITEADEDEIRRLRNNAVKWNTLFVNISSLFPMLGIFGTVWSLLKMVGSSEYETGFYAALTSTAWGLVFAMGFKTVEFIPASLLDAGELEADHAFEKIEFDKRTDETEEADHEKT